MPQPAQACARMARVRFLTTFVIVITGLFCLYWSAHMLSWLIPFITQNNVQAHPLVPQETPISFGQKTTYAALFSVMLVLAWGSFIAAIRLLLALRRGAFFTADTCTRIQMLGLSLIAVMVADSVLTAFGMPVLTSHPDVVASGGYVAPALVFDSGDITVALCGLGFFIIGWVLAEGARIVAENKAFV